MIGYLREWVENYRLRRAYSRYVRTTPELERVRNSLAGSVRRLARLHELGAPRVLIDNEVHLIQDRKRRIAELEGKR